LLEDLLSIRDGSRRPSPPAGRLGRVCREVAGAREKAGGHNDAETIAGADAGRAIVTWGKESSAEVVISGGGAKNPALVERLAAKIQPRPVVLFDQVFFNGEA
jgi:1,6-anhydro-N-acetylmuramate kinase